MKLDRETEWLSITKHSFNIWEVKTILHLREDICVYVTSSYSLGFLNEIIWPY